MRIFPASFSTELQLPLAGQADDWTIDNITPGWLSELQEVRGRILFDGGRRPNFRKSDGTYRDSDSLDCLSYHLMVRCRGDIVGCARIMPLLYGAHGVVETTLGTDGFEKMLATIGASRRVTSEASRWIVAPEFRGGSLGFHLVAASWAVGRWLGARIGFVAAGTRNQQDKMLIKMGGRSTSLPFIPSEEFDDELHILHFDVHHPSASMGRWIDHMNTALNLNCLLEKVSRSGDHRSRILEGSRNDIQCRLRPTRKLNYQAAIQDEQFVNPTV